MIFTKEYFRIKAKECYERRKSDPERMKKFNDYHRKYRAKNKDKVKARSKIYSAVRNQTIIPKKCKICGKKAHAHHPDYREPLMVDWLCPLHHKEAHEKLSTVCRLATP